VTLAGTLFFVRIISNVNTRTAVTEDLLAERVKDARDIRTLEKKTSEARTIHRTLGQYLLDTEHVDTFISLLEDFGPLTKTEARVRGIEPLPEAPDTFSVSFTATGTFSRVMNILEYIETLPYDVRIMNISLYRDAPSTVKSNTKKPPLWTIDIVFNVTTQ
jgi:hypothetical protein